MDPGFIAAATFLVTSAGGSIAQLLKLRRRRALWISGKLTEEQICEGLLPVRELWSFTAFLLFALSGLTRSYIDYVLVGTRLPVLIVATATIWTMSVHVKGEQSGRSARRNFKIALCLNGLFIVVAALVLMGFTLGGSIIATGVDSALACVSVLLFYGKVSQTKLMLLTKKTHAVSWLREIGLVIKDVSGLTYAAGVGPELFWIAVTHALSAISSAGICIVKYWAEQLNFGRRAPTDSNK